MSNEDEVRKASEQFYAALNSAINGDAGPMAEIWSHSDSATTMHPTGGMEAGWAKVSETWRQISRLFSKGWVKLSNQTIEATDNMAYEVGTELGRATLGGNDTNISQRTTNVYKREAGKWKIVHHHVDPDPGMLNVVGYLQDEEQ